MTKQAKWITGEKTDICLSFRRSFVLTDAVTEAKLTCACFGVCNIRLNGITPTGYTPFFPLTDPDKVIYYRTYDVTNLLYQGENVISALCGTNVPFLCALEGKLENGDSFAIYSDSVWCTYSDGPYRYGSFRKEIHDASKNSTLWQKPGYDDAGWEGVRIVPGPGGSMMPDICPPTVRAESVPPCTILENGIFDFGKQITGNIAFHVQGKTGDVIYIRFAKDSRSLSDSDPDVYILGSDSEESRQPLFSLHTFRFVSIRAFRNDQEIVPAIRLLAAQSVHTALSTQGTFSIKDDYFSKVHKQVADTTLSDWQSVPCFSAEKYCALSSVFGYASAAQSFFRFDTKDAYRKWLFDGFVCQTADGQIPSVFPQMQLPFTHSDPLCGLAMILIPFEYFRFCGDTELLSMFWQPMKRFLSFLSDLEEDGFICYGGEDLQTPKNAPPLPEGFLSTAYYFRFAEAAATIATLLGENSSVYEQKAAAVRRAFRERFLRNGHLHAPSQTAIACVLALHLNNAEEKDGLLADLIETIANNNGHFDGGVLGFSFLITALGEADQTDLCCRIIKRTFPTGNVPFVDIERLFFRYIAGINPSPHRLIITPTLPSGTDGFSASACGVNIEMDRKRLHICAERAFLLRYGEEERQLMPGDYNFPVI